MTLIEQQRLIGAVLLLLIISVVSFFLISGTNNSVIETDSFQGEQSFTSVVQPISEEEIEIVDYVDETLLDPQNLSQDPIPAATETLSVNEIVVEQQTKLDTVPTPTPLENIVVETLPNWVLQLGSFSVKNNADALVSQLKKLGYAPSVESSDTDNGEIYRVRLAPMKNKITAEKIAQELAKKLNLTPRVFQQKS